MICAIKLRPILDLTRTRLRKEFSDVYSQLSPITFEKIFKKFISYIPDHILIGAIILNRFENLYEEFASMTLEYDNDEDLNQMLAPLSAQKKTEFLKASRTLILNYSAGYKADGEQKIILKILNNPKFDVMDKQAIYMSLLTRLALLFHHCDTILPSGMLLSALQHVNKKAKRYDGYVMPVAYLESIAENIEKKESKCKSG